VAVLDEPVYPIQLVGAALVLAGVMLVTLRPQAEPGISAAAGAGRGPRG